MGRAIPDSLFGLAPNGVYRAPSITLGAVGSYPTFSPLPGEPGGLFSVALAVGDALKRRLPRVSRPQGAGYAASCPAEFGLSSPGKPEATLRPPRIEERRQATAAPPQKQAAWPFEARTINCCSRQLPIQNEQPLAKRDYPGRQRPHHGGALRQKRCHHQARGGFRHAFLPANSGRITGETKPKCPVFIDQGTTIHTFNLNFIPDAAMNGQIPCRKAK